VKHYGKGFCKPHWIEQKQKINLELGMICKYKDCTNGGFIKNYCKSHNSYHVEEVNRESGKICKTEGCEIGIYSKGLCKKHRTMELNGGYAKRHLCNFPGCEKMVLEDSGRLYCSIHDNKVSLNKKYGLKHTSTESLQGISTSGDKNVHWNGGVSEYKNHYIMKKIRKEMLKDSPACEDCGNSKAIHVHHKDKTKDNHSVDNLKLLCIKCHVKYHIGDSKSYKYKNIYGMSLEKLSKHFGKSRQEIRHIHNNAFKTIN